MAGTKDYCAIVREYLTVAMAMVDGAIFALGRADEEASNGGAISVGDITDHLEEAKRFIELEYGHAASLRKERPQ
jgi:hypothetical protein